MYTDIIQQKLFCFERKKILRKPSLVEQKPSMVTLLKYFFTIDWVDNDDDCDNNITMIMI